MLSFFKLFYRNAYRNRIFTTLNIIGLAIGMAAFIIIMLWVKDELSYDKHNVNAARIYRMNYFMRYSGDESLSSYSPAPLAAALIRDYPEVEKSMRFYGHSNAIVKYNNISYNDYDIVYADSTVFGIFTIPLIKGNPVTALTSPYTVAISESIAKKYFGNEDPIEKILRFDNKIDYRVTAVYKDIPKTSHFHFNFIASLYSTGEYKNDIWLSNNFQTYFLLNKNADPVAFEEKLPQLIKKYSAPQAAQALGTTWEQLEANGLLLKFSIQHLTDIHLNTDVSGGFGSGGDIKYVYIFILIAVFIILLACINFTNLSTARSTTRLKDVGIRRVFGVQRSVLSLQFMVESFLIVFTAYILAMVLTEISLPFFNRLTDKSISINYFDIRFLAMVFGLVLAVSILAGAYPAIYFSSFKPISILKGDMVTGKKKSRFRSILVVGQFTISLFLLSSVLILNKQMKYIQSKNLGFNKEHLLVITKANLLEKNIENFKNHLNTIPQILSFTESGFLPSPSNRNSGSVWRDGIMSNDPVGFSHFFVDHDYVKTFDMKIVRGRGFSKEFSTDSSAIIINQAAVKLLGWQDPIGRKIGAILKPDFDVNKPVLDVYTIIGVVEDFNYYSLHEPVRAMALYLKKSDQMITCRLRADANIPQIVASLKAKWDENAPGQPFEYDFVHESLSRQYSSEARLGKILGIFTGLAFFVSCLGLFGLALFASEHRKKEIGLRKVNGSGIGEIVWLLSSDFTRLVLISFVMACPISYFLMEKWLQNFAYRTNITVWIFVLTMLLTYIIALSTIGYQSYKAAAANPVNTLRSE